MKIGVVSDSHDRAPMLVAAVGEARRAGAEAIIHCGDIIGANTLRPLLELGLPTHIVHGNNVGDPLALCNLCAASSGLLLLKQSSWRRGYLAGAFKARNSKPARRLPKTSPCQP